MDKLEFYRREYRAAMDLLSVELKRSDLLLKQLEDCQAEKSRLILRRGDRVVCIAPWKKGKTGRIVGFSLNGTGIYVKVDGLKRHQLWHLKFWEKVKKSGG